MKAKIGKVQKKIQKRELYCFLCSEDINAFRDIKCEFENSESKNDMILHYKLIIRKL